MKSYFTYDLLIIGGGISALENFYCFTKDLVSFYKSNKITPIIETDFSSPDKLDSVYSLFRN